MSKNWTYKFFVSLQIHGNAEEGINLCQEGCFQAWKVICLEFCLIPGGKYQIAMTHSILERKFLWRHISKSRKATNLKFFYVYWYDPYHYQCQISNQSVNRNLVFWVLAKKPPIAAEIWNRTFIYKGLTVTWFFSHPTLKACNSPYMQCYFKRFFCFAFLGSYIFISDEKVKAKSNRNINCIFHSLGNIKGRTVDHFFYASHICHNFP